MYRIKHNPPAPAPLDFNTPATPIRWPTHSVRLSARTTNPPFQHWTPLPC